MLLGDGAETLSQRLDGKRIVVCLGPGGVGKTTVSAAVAVAGALSGRRALALTIDPARRLANALGLTSLADTRRTVPDSWWEAAGLRPTGRLDAMMLDLKRSADALVERYAPSPESARRILENPLYAQASTAMAGSHDYMAMESLYELSRECDYDLLVLDTPPAAHALDFLEAPSRLAEGMGSGLEGFLAAVAGMGRGGLGFLQVALRIVVVGLSRFTGSQLLVDLAAFLLDASEMFGGFKARAQSVMDLLGSDESAFLVVTAPTAFATAEALHLREALRDRHLPFSGYVVNRTTPALGVVPARDAWPASAVLADRLRAEHRDLAFVDPTMLRRTVASLYTALDDLQVREALERSALAKLGDQEDAPHATVPELLEDVHDLGGLVEVARALGLL